jgi:hypothetical protein
MSIQYRIDNLLRHPAPLYHRLPHMAEPQKAILEMDFKGVVTATWDKGVESSFPEFARGAYLRWPLSPRADGESLHDFLQSDPMRSLLEQVHNGHQVEWNGSELISHLDEPAQIACSKMGFLLKEKPYLERTVYDLKDWVQVNFRVDDLFASRNINAYIQKLFNKTEDMKREELAAFMGGTLFEKVEKLCLDYVEQAIDYGRDSYRNGRKVAQMLAEYNPDRYEKLLDLYNIGKEESLPFNWDGHFDDSVRDSLQTERAPIVGLNDTDRRA